MEKLSGAGGRFKVCREWEVGGGGGNGDRKEAGGAGERIGMGWERDGGDQLGESRKPSRCKGAAGPALTLSGVVWLPSANSGEGPRRN